MRRVAEVTTRPESDQEWRNRGTGDLSRVAEAQGAIGCSDVNTQEE